MNDETIVNTANTIPTLQGLESKQYSESHYRLLSSLIEARSAHQLYEKIVQTNYAVQTILAFKRLILEQFDQNVVLAANTSDVGVELRIISCKISLDLMTLECHESDTWLPSFVNDKNAILTMFIDFVSRSKNARERDQLLKTEYSVTSNQPAQKDPGMLSFKR